MRCSETSSCCLISFICGLLLSQVYLSTFLSAFTFPWTVKPVETGVWKYIGTRTLVFHMSTTMHLTEITLQCFQILNPLCTNRWWGRRRTLWYGDTVWWGGCKRWTLSVSDSRRQLWDLWQDAENHYRDLWNSLEAWNRLRLAVVDGGCLGSKDWFLMSSTARIGGLRRCWNRWMRQAAGKGASCLRRLMGLE